MKNIIELKRVSKLYTSKSAKPTFIEHLKRLNDKKITALKSITLKIKPGEKVGIIGNNGSGKTTLLKTIAGITKPSGGELKVKGKIVSLIGLGAGFNMELSGRENIMISGLLLGMKKQEIEEKLSEIIAYSEIEEFIDEPLYTYSEGM
jgi:ABC-type polysaccharide/polyol phosphate transport system ATPase subunit